MYINNDLGCCGIKEIDGIGDHRNTPKNTILEVARDHFFNHNRSAFIIFSDIGRKTAGINLQKYITKNKLGTIVKTETKKNPNTASSLMVWTWAINQANLKRYWNKNK